jgi:integrase
MPVAAITKRTIDTAAPADRDRFIWDGEVKGFGVKVTPAGAKVYIVQYRTGGRGSPTKRVTIGRHGTPWTPEQARREAKRILGEVAGGRDPGAARQAERVSLTMTALIRAFLAEHVEPKRKPRSVVEYRRLFHKLILPELGRKRVKDVTRLDVARLHHDLRSTPYQANRVLAVLSKLLNWAERYGYRSDGSNPCRHVEKYREHHRERFLSAAELGRLGEALRSCESDDTVTPWVAAAIRLLIFTGARLSEILTARWSWVDLDAGTITLPDSKTGQKIIYLNAPALEFLAGLPRLEGNLM